MRDQEGLLLARTRRGKRHQQADPACSNVFRGVDPLVADHAAVRLVLRVAEQARCDQRPQECLDLARQPQPDRRIVRLERSPTRAEVDALDHGQAAPLPAQQATGRAAPGSAGERAQCQRSRVGGAQRLDRIDAVSDEPRALRLAQHACRPRTRPQQQLVVGCCLPQRPVLLHAAQRCGHGTAVGEALVAAAQPVIGLDSRKAHHGLFAVKGEIAQVGQRIAAGIPFRRRVHQQQQVVVAAELRGHQQCTRPHVPVTLERRQAEEVDVFRRAQRKQAGATLRRSDQVIVRQRRAVVPVGVAVNVADRVSGTGPERPVRPGRRQLSRESHQRGLHQRTADAAGRTAADRDSSEDLLVLDELRAPRPNPLHDQVEAVLLVRGDVVVVHGRAQCLPRAGTQGLQHELLPAARQHDRGPGAAVCDPDDYRLAATAVEKLLDRIRQRTRLPEAAEHLLVLREALQPDGPVDRAA